MDRENPNKTEAVLAKLMAISNARSETHLAQMLGVHQSTLSGWKKDNSIPYKRIIENFIEIDLNWLFKDGSMVPNSLEEPMAGYGHSDTPVIKEKKILNELRGAVSAMKTLLDAEEQRLIDIENKMAKS